MEASAGPLIPPWKIQRRLLTKAEETSDAAYGTDPYKRPIRDLIRFGVINLDKPAGPTSHEVVAWVKRVMGVDRAGHAGTLDPGVTGVLPIGLEDATKLLQAVIHSGKEYVGLMELHQDVSQERLLEAFREFTGEIYQRPPVRASVKREIRRRIVYELELLELEQRRALFRVAAQAGTYIRKLCLSPSTEVFLTDGRVVKIKDLAEKFALPNGGGQPAYAPLKTPTLTGSFEIGEGHVMAFQKLPAPKEMIRITTESGISLEVTPDHEVLIDSDSGCEWRPAGALKERDYIYSPRVINLPEEAPYVVGLLDGGVLVDGGFVKNVRKQALRKKVVGVRKAAEDLSSGRKNIPSQGGRGIGVNEVLGYLLGMLVADGHIVPEGARCARPRRLVLFTTSPKLKEEFFKASGALFSTASIRASRVGRKLFKIKADNSFLAGVAFYLGGLGKKAVLAQLFGLPRSVIKAFLRGYFDEDGTALCKKRAGARSYHTAILLNAASPETAKRLYQLFKRLGIRSRVFSTKAHGRVPKRAPFAHFVTLFSPGDKLKFIEEVGSSNPSKREILKRVKKALKRCAGAEDLDHVSQKCARLIEAVMKKHKIPADLLGRGGAIRHVLSGKLPPTRCIVRTALHRFDELGINDTDLDELRRLCEGQYYLERIRSVKRVKAKTPYVYDLTVHPTHNFIPEGAIVVSNCSDIGDALGIGAHLKELRRTRAGPFVEGANQFTLHEVVYAYERLREGYEEHLRKVLRPVEEVLAYVPKVYVKDSAVDAICHGASVAVPGIVKLDSGIEPGMLVAIMTLKGEAVALGTGLMSSEDILNSEKGLAVKTERVAMPRGTYPALWRK